MELITELNNRVISGNIDDVYDLVQKALDQKIKVKKILNEGLIAAMDVVGLRFEKGELFIPEMLKSAQAMNKGLELLRPLFQKSGIKPIGTIVIGTVRGDRHDIGKSLVSMMMSGAGFKMVDLGVDVHPDKFLEAAEKSGAQLVAISALLTTTLPAMKETILNLKNAKFSKNIRTIVGGAPVNQNFADEIGADGYAPDAALGVGKAKELVKSVIAED